MRLIDANDIRYTTGHLKSLGGLSDFSSKSYASKADIYSVPVFDLEKHDEKVRAEVFREIESAMCHQCFECDNDEDMQKWDGGNWIRYKLFENVMDKMKEQK